MKPFWTRTVGEGLAQGDLLHGCRVPFFGPEFGTDAGEHEVEIREGDLIIITQSCDLENDKVSLVALCPIHTLPSFEEANPAFLVKGRWESVRKGQQPGLHLLASPDSTRAKSNNLTSTPMPRSSRQLRFELDDPSLGSEPLLPFLFDFGQPRRSPLRIVADTKLGQSGRLRFSRMQKSLELSAVRRPAASVFAHVTRICRPPDLQNERSAVLPRTRHQRIVDP